MGPLSGLKVIELAHIMSGPTAGMLLADMGADVIKVERVPDGDDTRRFTPPEVNGESSAFMMMNRNKRGIALDLKHPAANAALRRIIDRADVVVENFRVGTMERLGLGYEVLRRSNPRLIYCALSGYGLTGPDATKGGFDLVAQGLSGLMRITGDPGGPPTKVGSPVTDINAGILGALGIVSAYVHLLRSGEGQLVDTSLLEAGVMQTFWQSAIFIGSGREIGPLGSAHPMTAPYQAFETGDGWITVGASNQVNYVRLTQVLEAPELRDDPRFADNKLRMANLEGAGRRADVALQTQALGRVARRARRGRRTGRSGQDDRANARRPAGAGARHGRRPHASARRRNPSDRLPDQVFRHTLGRRTPGADARSAYDRGAGRIRLRCR